jgi:hypothetical protein
VITTMAVDANGLTLAGSADFSLGYGPARVRYEEGILYTDRGLAINPVDSTLVGTYPMTAGEFGQGVAPDSGLNRVFILMRSAGHYLVRSYELQSFTPVAEVPLTGIDFQPNQPLRIIRFGEEGLAIPTGDGRVLLITGPFVGPGAG